MYAISFFISVAPQVENPSMPNDEGITPLHNAVCAGHHHIVKFLLDFGVNVNAADSDGWSVPQQGAPARGSKPFGGSALRDAGNNHILMKMSLDSAGLESNEVPHSEVA